MNIKEIREKAKLTTREFAKVLGVAHASVYLWEHNKSKINFKNQRKIDKFVKDFEEGKVML